MKFSSVSIIALMFIVIAVAIAGCSSQTTTTQSGGSGQAAAGGAASPGSSSSGSSSQASTSVSGSDLFSGLSYNWVEYQMAMSSNTAGSAANGMTMFIKYDKSGTCTMWFQGGAASQMNGAPTTMDCSARGGQAPSNPNTVSPSTQVSCSPVDEPVTVPAGTFTATKCTVTATNGNQQVTSTVWVVKNKFLVKMEASTAQGTMDMELNSYG